MRPLKDILENVNVISVTNNKDIAISDISFDSNTVNKKSLFVAIKGTKNDGHQYISSAIEKGAIVVIYDSNEDIVCNDKAVWIKVENTSYSLGIISHNFYYQPSKALKVIGITGTNGKTTCAFLLYQSLKSMGYKVGLFSTISNYIHNKRVPATHTTPDALQISRLMGEMVDQGCQWVVMEVSSHALIQERIAGIKFYGAIFTNITHDHLDFHKDFQSYIYAKKKLFDALDESSFALVNKDSKQYEVITQNSKARKFTYGIKSLADYNTKVISNTIEGLELTMDNQNIWFRLVGQFNAYNLLAVYATLLIVKIQKETALKCLSSIEPIIGRFQIHRNAQNKIGVVDYCHTPDALENVLETIQTVKKNENIITVFGCGGNRDKAKRPKMTKIALKHSDTVIITADNPRNESLKEIIEDMLKGISDSEMKKIITIDNRQEAIKTASRLANSNDIVLVAGKGHEEYQEINGEKEKLNDMKYLKEYL